MPKRRHVQLVIHIDQKQILTFYWLTRSLSRPFELVLQQLVLSDVLPRPRCGDNPTHCILKKYGYITSNGPIRFNGVEVSLTNSILPGFANIP
ncbi:hypothetical protein DSUL_20267 [Desulfovibrionales bacterium]